MSKKRFVFSLVVIVLLLVGALGVYAQQSASMALVRVAHFASGASNVDVFVDGQMVLQNVPFAQVSNYLQVSPGEHNIAIAPVGMGQAFAGLAQAHRFDASHSYVVAAIGQGSFSATAAQVQQDQTDAADTQNQAGNTGATDAQGQAGQTPGSSFALLVVDETLAFPGQPPAGMSSFGVPAGQTGSAGAQNQAGQTDAAAEQSQSDTGGMTDDTLNQQDQSDAAGTQSLQGQGFGPARILVIHAISDAGAIDIVNTASQFGQASIIGQTGAAGTQGQTDQSGGAGDQAAATGAQVIYSGLSYNNFAALNLAPGQYNLMFTPGQNLTTNLFADSTIASNFGSIAVNAGDFWLVGLVGSAGADQFNLVVNANGQSFGTQSQQDQSDSDTDQSQQADDAADTGAAGSQTGTDGTGTGGTGTATATPTAGGGS